ncbi:MAG: hypothetical protein JWQ62_2185 [Lacunisphaera sp.]|nr:hypothetical protein [Lacunisphaera sp.]
MSAAVSDASGPDDALRCRLLADYFASGWAFLLPYLGTYMVYAACKWPVNPTAKSAVPSLLAVFRALHFAHVMLATGAWRFLARAGRPAPGAAGSEVFRAILPWLLLALLFWIPGVYLEFPADPWTHYARINEWSALDFVRQHSAWSKFSYFLGYSFIGGITPLSSQVRCFDLYYTGCCILLCWQYYRLARALGLGERAGFLFVLLQALLSGNNLFGFYRYYGMSSTLFAQLGVVAFLRLAVEILQPAGQALAAGAAVSRPRQWMRGTAALLLLVLIAFNHPQGLPMTAVVLAAVLGWRLARWKPAATASVLGASVVLLSWASIRWFPRNPALDAVYRHDGWLTSWYGFNVFSSSSPAFALVAAILGLTGALNLAAALLLLRRNHLVAWLTLGPLIALCLPCLAIPLAHLLARSRPADIVVFPRLLFAIPPSLALVVLAQEFSSGMGRSARESKHTGNWSWLLLPTALLLGMTLSTVTSFNRIYHAFVIPPADLAMRRTMDSLAAAWPAGQPVRDNHAARRPVFGPRGIGFALMATGQREVVEPYRLIASEPWNIPSERAERLMELVHRAATGGSGGIVIQPEPTELYSPVSFAGFLSQHWQPQELPLEFAAAPEIAGAIAAEPTSVGKKNVPSRLRSSVVEFVP